MSGPAQYYGVSLLRNLYAGLRLALFLPLRASDYRVSPLHYTLLVAFNFAIWVIAAGARVGFEGDFEPTSLVVYLATVPLLLLAALLVAMAYGTPGELMLIAIALSASDLVFEVVSFVLPGVSAAGGFAETMALAFFVWMWVVSIRAVAVCCGMRRPQFYQAALAVSAMIAIVFFLFPKADVWLPQEAQAAEATPITEERIFHLQGELLERSLAAIKPGTPGKAEIYFIGFAPDSSQDVFLREMRFVKRLFDERFGTAGHSIALISSQDALEEFPIATVTSLGRALRRVGEAMNADDVLFLFLSAHGDRSHRLSASQPPLELTPLTPTALARMLQDAGIKWRVVVVSACYSGGFIEPLRDDNSVVITAAAPDRTSFGCESGRDFTYFGQAYFRDALSQTRSFIKAFELARDIVGKEEAAERLKPSLPQISVGRAIAERLKDLAQ
jgi:hypothetical protein